MSNKVQQKPIDELTNSEKVLENRRNIGIIQTELDNIERGDADFVDGTPTNNVNISTSKKSGPLTFRIQDTNGGWHTFEMTDKGELYAENLIGAPETVTQKITFDKNRDLEYIDQDGGKIKVNNITIWDQYGTALGAMKFNSKEIATEPGDLPTLAQVKSLITGGGVSISFADGVEVEKVKWADKADLTYVDAKLADKADKAGNVDDTNIEQAGELFFGKKLNYDGNGQSKLNFYATNENGKEEIRVQFDQTPIMNIERGSDGNSLIEMLNGQINKVVNSVSETHLVNRQEAKKIVSDAIASAGLGQWATTYDKYVANLKPKQTADQLNSGYDWTGDNVGLDRYSQIGHQAGWISIPDGTLDLWYKDTKKPFYEITLIGNFQPIYGEVLWEKDSILITPNDIGEEDRFTTFRVRVEDRDSKGLLFDKEVYEIKVPYYVNVNTDGKLELELGLIATYTKQTKTSKDDTKPTTSYGSFDLTSDIDVRVLELQQLDTASIDLSNYYTKPEVDGKIQVVDSKLEDATKLNLIKIDYTQTTAGYVEFQIDASKYPNGVQGTISLKQDDETDAFRRIPVFVQKGMIRNNIVNDGRGSAYVYHEPVQDKYRFGFNTAVVKGTIQGIVNVKPEDCTLKVQHPTREMSRQQNWEDKLERLVK